MNPNAKVRLVAAVAALAPLLVAAACADAPSAPQAGGSVAGAASLARSTGAGSACVAGATVVVTTEAELDQAAAAAHPGDIIAISGMIPMSVAVATTTPDLTFTCATPGSGLRLAPTATGVVLIRPWGDRDVVQGLTLDATGGTYAVYVQANDGARVQYNTITCGDSCGFWVGTTNAVVSDNVIVQPHSGASGLHFQSLRDPNQNIVRPIDGTRIERNSLTATTPTGTPGFGALRPRDGTGITVADNVISGPWSNGISSVNVNGSAYTRNVVTGTSRYGVVINVAGSANLAPSANDTFTANRVTDAGVAGFSLDNACFNVFRGNPSLGSTPLAFILQAATGANTVEGTAAASVDHGSLDCDGDGQADPNKVSGQVSHSIAAAGLSLNASARVAGRALHSASGAAGVLVAQQ